MIVRVRALSASRTAPIRVFGPVVRRPWGAHAHKTLPSHPPRRPRCERCESDLTAVASLLCHELSTSPATARELARRNFGRNRSMLAEFRVGFGRDGADTGRFWPNSGHRCPTSGTITTNIDQFGLASAHSGRRSAELGPTSTKFDQAWLGRDQIRPVSTKVGPNSNNLGPRDRPASTFGPKSVNVGPDFDHVWADSANIGLESTKVGPDSTDLGPISGESVG